MARVKRGIISHKHREKLLKLTKGYRWGRKSKERLAKEALLHAGKYAFRDRKAKKREFRRLWQVQINAGAREHGLSYSRFMSLLKKKGIALDRKILAQLAREHPGFFDAIIQQVQK